MLNQPPTPKIELSGVYTDAPDLHPNLIVGSLQLLIWFFFHPSAWRNHIARIDPTLHPNFSLTDLSAEQRWNAQVQRLLIMGYGVLPGVAGLLAGVLLALLGAPIKTIVFSAIFGAVAAIGGGLLSNQIIGTAVSLVLGLGVGAAGGVGMGLEAMMTAGLLQRRGSMAEILTEALVFGTAFGLVFGMNQDLLGRFPRRWQADRSAPSLVRSLIVIIAGMVASGSLLFLGGFSRFDEPPGLTWICLLVIALIGAAVSWGRNPPAGIVSAIIAALAFYVAIRLPVETAFGILLFGTLIIPPYILVERIAGPWAGAVASALGGGSGWIISTMALRHMPPWPILPLAVMVLVFGISVYYWRQIMLYPLWLLWNGFLRWTDARTEPDQPGLFHRHSAFWDEHQRLPLFGLEEYLLLTLERNPIEGHFALNYLAAGRQRWAAQIAQIELEARALESCKTVPEISNAHHRLITDELEGPASALLRSFSRISRDAEAALSQESAFNCRLALIAVEDRLDSLSRELTRSSDRYAVRFRPIAATWQAMIADQVQLLVETVELRQEIDNPYTIGLPLTEQQEIFVGRVDICARIENLLLDRRSPPLLLYGQRRMGKTSLLNNLGRLLPSTITPLFVDLQGPAAWTSDHAGFLYNLARGMITSAQRQRGLALPPISREALTADPFTQFDEWLDRVESLLGQGLALLTLDEFETLDSAFSKGRLDAEMVLGTLRHLIQHRPCFKVLLAGSHSLDEFQRWSGYLINTEVVHIGYLHSTEARQLIERPTKTFGLAYEPAAVEQVLALTGGHPYLVQLLCSEIVTRKNEQPPAQRRLATCSDVDAAVSESLSRGSLFFADIERNQIDEAGRTCLRFLASRGQGAVIKKAELLAQIKPAAEADQVLTLLYRRELIEPIDDGYRFQVELIRRWFAESTLA